MVGFVEITRVEEFSAAHRLHSKFLSEEENQKLYGKCNGATCHGHNYKLKVTIRNVPDSETGMVSFLSFTNAIYFFKIFFTA